MKERDAYQNGKTLIMICEETLLKAEYERIFGTEKDGAICFEDLSFEEVSEMIEAHNK